MGVEEGASGKIAQKTGSKSFVSVQVLGDFAGTRNNAKWK
jgi:hypothetical protein